MNNKNDFVIAAVVVACSLALLGALVILIGGDGGILSRPHMRFSVDFPDITGIGRNSDVFYAGDRIGRIENIEHVPYVERQRPDLAVRANVAITRNIPIAANLRATIGTSSILGEKHLALLPLDSGGESLADGAHIIGTQGSGMLDQFIPGGDALLADLREIVSSLRSITTPLIKNDAGKRLSSTLDNLEHFSVELNSVITGKDGSPGAAAQLTTALQKLETSATGLQNLILGPEGHENEGLSARTYATLNNVENISRELNLMLAGDKQSPGLRKRLDEITSDLQKLLSGGDTPGLGQRLDQLTTKANTLIEELNVLTVWGSFFTGTLAGRPNRLIFGNRMNDVPTKEEIIQHLRKSGQPYPVVIEEERRRNDRKDTPSDSSTKINAPKR